MRTNRLTERDLSRIVKRVMNEQIETQDEYDYCNVVIPDETIQRQSTIIQNFADKLKDLENITYDCDLHKFLVRKMVLQEMYDFLGAEYIPHISLPEGFNMNDLEKFLKRRYDILK
jgi:hypothetical protein